MRIPSDIPLASYIRQLIKADRIELFYLSDDWKELRLDVLEELHYECSECLKKGEYTRADCVHHVNEVRVRPDLALSRFYIDDEGKQRRQLVSMMYGNITNMNEIVKVYLSICIDPLADMISEEFTRKYFTFDEWQAGNYVKVDTSCINHIDILEVADKVDKAISSGVTNIDEMRERLGMPELKTEFSQAHWMTKNYALAEDMMTNAEGSENE